MKAASDAAANSATNLRSLAERIAAWRRPLLLSHDRPDGDALGSLIALRELLAARGSRPVAVLYEPPPRRYAFLPTIDAFRVFKDLSVDELAAVDGVVIVDTCAWSQLTVVASWLRQAKPPTVVLDHHQTSDADVAETRVIDGDASAAAILVRRLAVAAGWPITPVAATALFVGISTDTGWFRYSNTTPEALRAAADLLEAGVDADALHKALYLSDSIASLRARAAAMAGLKLYADGRLAIISVTRPMLEAVEATPSDLEEVVNVPLVTADVEVSAVLVAWDDNIVKTSFRSKGAVDVARLAATFGGGGHSRAAGARIGGNLADVQQRVVAAAEAALQLVHSK